MGLEESFLGNCILAVACAGFAYYSVWILSAPFVDESSAFAKLFPPKHLGTAVPQYIALALICLVVFNIGWSLIAAHPRFQAQGNKKKQS